MKVFFLSLLTFYFAANVYVAFSIYNLLPTISLLRFFALAIVVAGSVFPIIFFVFGENLPIKLASLFYNVGTTWMIAFVYLFLMFLLFDLLKLSNHLFHFTAHANLKAIFKHNGITSLICLGAIFLLLVYGNIIYHNKKRINIEIESHKIKKPLKIIGVSDLHLGYTISRKELAKWVKMINSESPDMILVAGDLIDNQLRPINQQAMHQELQKMKAPLGVFACTGNHEYISGIKESVEFYEKSGIKLLRDSAINLDDLLIIGREDFSYKNRKPLKKIIDHPISDNQFTILLDHQPTNLDDAVKNKIDFQFSGHTHFGQIFPASLITKTIFELAHGYKRKENTHFYVSSGLGIWGGKFRIGTRSEYLVLNLNPSNAEKQ